MRHVRIRRPAPVGALRSLNDGRFRGSSFELVTGDAFTDLREECAERLGIDCDAYEFALVIRSGAGEVQEAWMGAGTVIAPSKLIRRVV